LRFQTTDRVPCEDAELVLAVLEDRLHMLAYEVVREGQRITLFGLGPSPRAVNPHDKTMIDVSAVDGVTTIDADVTFQASAFLGEAPQDQIVLGKLERVFDEIKAELGLNARREITNGASGTWKIVPIKSAAEPVVAANAEMASGMSKASAGMVAVAEAADVLEDVSTAGVEEPQVAEIATAPVAEIAKLDEEPVETAAMAEPTAPVPIVASTSDNIPSAVVEEAQVAEIAPVPAAEIARVDEEPVETAPIAAAVAPAPIVAETPIRIVFAEPEPGPVVEPESIVVLKPEPIVVLKREPIANMEPEPIAIAKPETFAIPKPRVQVPAERKQEAERWVADALSGFDDKEPGTWRRVGWTAAAVGLVAIVILGARDLMNLDKTEDPDSQPVTVSAMTSTPVSTSAPTPITAPASTTAPAPEAKPPLQQESDDPADVVKQWELAMQSRDGAAQAAFYADTVGRYFLRNNVKNDAVLADKQAAIEKRKDNWSVQMDRVKVDRHGNNADVMLVKHFVVKQKGEPASESFIPSQLKLKREDGKWRIVSERDLGWATSLDDLDG
jgi:ketosteroid isomerase-like protein